MATPSAGSKQVASVHVDIGADTSGFEKGAASVSSGLVKMAGQFLTSAAVIDGLRRALDFSIQSAAEAQRVDAQLAAVIQSTGAAAGMTKTELDNLATSLSKVTTYDDEAIKGAEALLLTFTQISSDVFPSATQAILDMSTAMGQDLKTSTIQIGKALNDPIAGLTALRRVGVSFTEDQKEMIKTLVKTGDVLGAQQIILDELSREFGGSATAAANTYEGQLAQLRNEVGNLGEAFGEDLLPDLIAFTKEAKQSVIWVTENYEALKEWTYWATHLLNPLLFISDELRVNGTGWRDVTEEVSRYNPVAEETNKITEEQAKRINDASIARWDGIASLYAQKDAIEDVNVSEEEYLKLIEMAQEYNADLIDSAIGITKANENYQKSQDDIMVKMADLRAEGEKLYPWEHEKIQENIDALEELGEQYFKNRDDFIKASQDKIAMMAVEKIALMDGIEGYSDAEYELAKSILERSDIATAAAFEQMQAQELLTSAVATGKITVEEFGNILETAMRDGKLTVDEVTAAINNIPSSKTITLSVNSVFSQASASSSYGAATVSGRRASGGQVNAGQSYLVGEQGMEIFTPNANGMITPNSRASSMSGGGVNVTIVLDSATPDPERVAYNLKPAVERVIRDMQRAGTV